MATRRPPHPKWPRCVTARPRARHTWPATVAALLVAAVALSLPTHSAGKTPGEIVCTPSETWSVFVTYATPDEANHIEYTLNGVLTVQPVLPDTCNSVDHCSPPLQYFPSSSTVFDISIKDGAVTKSTMATTFLTKPYYGTQVWQFATTPPVPDVTSPAVQYGDKVLLALHSAQFGVELWTMDSRRGRVHMVRDLVVGLPSSTPANFTTFPAADRVLFIARPTYSTAERVLWATDATYAGTETPLFSALYKCRDVSHLTVIDSRAFFTASCDVGATSVKGTRAYYLYTDLTVHQVPIPNIKEHQVAANADMAASGYLGRDGVVYFTAGITCSDLYMWNTALTAAANLTDCAASGADAGDPFVVTNTGVIMFSYFSWWTSTGDSNVAPKAVAATANDVAIGTPVWLPVSHAAYMVGLGQPPKYTLYRYSVVSGGIAVQLEDTDEPTPKFYESAAGDGVAVIGGQLFFAAGAISSGGPLSRVYATQTSSSPVVVDHKLPLNQEVVGLFAATKPDGSSVLVVVTADATTVVVYALDASTAITTSQDGSFVEVLKETSSYLYGRSGPQDGLFTLGTSNGTHLVDLTASTSQPLYTGAGAVTVVGDAFGTTLFTLADSIVAPVAAATRVNTTRVRASGGDPLLVGGVRAWSAEADVTWMCRFRRQEDNTGSVVTMAQPSATAADPLAVVCPTPLWEDVGGWVSVALIHVINQPQVTLTSPANAVNSPTGPPDEVSGLVSYPPPTCTSSSFDSVVAATEVQVYMAAAWWEVFGDIDDVGLTVAMALTVNGAGFLTAGDQYYCLVEELPGVYRAGAATVTAHSNLACVLPPLYEGFFMPTDTLPTADVMIAVGPLTSNGVYEGRFNKPAAAAIVDFVAGAAPQVSYQTALFGYAPGSATSASVRGFEWHGAVAKLVLFADATDMLDGFLCNFSNPSVPAASVAVTATHTAGSEPPQLQCQVPVWPYSAASVELRLFNATTSQEVQSTHPADGALVFHFKDYWVGASRVVWNAASLAMPVVIRGAGFVPSDTYYLWVVGGDALTEGSKPASPTALELTPLSTPIGEGSFAVQLRSSTEVVDFAGATAPAVRVAAVWVSLGTASLAAGGGNLVITGAGFQTPSVVLYTCRLTSPSGVLVAATTVASTTSLTCLFQTSALAAGSMQFSLHAAAAVDADASSTGASLASWQVCYTGLLNTTSGECTAPAAPLTAANVTIVPAWFEKAGASALSFRADGGGGPQPVIHLGGAGLDPNRTYQCCFDPVDPGVLVDASTVCGSPVHALSTAALDCAVPVWPYAAARTQLRVETVPGASVILPSAPTASGVEVTFTAGWFRFTPSRLPATVYSPSGAAVSNVGHIDLVGFGFHAATSPSGIKYVCEWEGGGAVEASPSPVAATNLTAIQCTVPAWPHTAATAAVTLSSPTAGQVAFYGSPSQFTFFEVVTGIRGASGEPRGRSDSAVVVVTGSGFRMGGYQYTCAFSVPGLPVNAVSLPSSTTAADSVLCAGLAAPASCGIVELRDASGALVPAAPSASGTGVAPALTYTFTAGITGVSPTSVSIDGGSQLTITGYGFRTDALYECVFTGLDDAGSPGSNVRTSAPVSPLQSSTLQCQTPVWALTAGDVILTVRVVNGTLPWGGGGPPAECSAADVAAATTVANSRLLRMLAGVVSFHASSSFAALASASSVPLQLTRKLASLGQVPVTVSVAPRLLLADGATWIAPGTGETQWVYQHTAIAGTGATVAVNATQILLQRFNASVRDEFMQFTMDFTVTANDSSVSVESPTSTAVSVCGIGTALVNFGDGSECRSCPAGFYNNGSLLSFCLPCPVSTYAATTTRGTTCTPCPEGAFTAQPGAATLADCRCQPVGWFRAPSDECRECDAGDPEAVCVDWVSGRQVLAEGWWLPSSVEHYANGTIEVPPERCYETASGSSPCLGGSEVGSCAVGHQGFLCSECSTGYYRLSNRCQVCPSYAAALVGIAVPLTLCALVAVLMGLPLSEKTRFSKFALAVNLFQFVSMAGSEKIQWPQILVDIYESLSFWNLNIELVSPDCLAPMTVQKRLIIFETVPIILALMCWVTVGVSRLWFACFYNDGVPRLVNYTKERLPSRRRRRGSGSASTRNPVDSARAAVTDVELTTRNPTAASDDGSGSADDSDTSGGSDAPAGRGGSRAVSAPSSAVINRGRGSKGGGARRGPRRASSAYRHVLFARPDHWVHGMVEKGWRASVIVAFISYMAVSRELFAALLCGNVAGRRLLLADMRVDCDSDEYTQILYLVGVGIALYPVGVLAAFAAIIFSGSHSKDDASHRRTMGVLFATYRKEMYAWELLSMVKRLMLVMLNGLIPLSLVSFKFASFSLVLSFYIFMLGVYQPYNDHTTNVVSLFFNQAQFLTAFGGVVFMFTANSHDAPTRHMVTFLIVTCFVAVMVVLAVAVWLRARQVISERRRAATARKDREALAERRRVQLAAELEAQASHAAAVPGGHTTGALLPAAHPESAAPHALAPSRARLVRATAAPARARRVEVARGRRTRDEQNPAPDRHGSGSGHAGAGGVPQPRSARRPVLTTKNILPSTPPEPWRGQQAPSSRRKQRPR